MNPTLNVMLMGGEVHQFEGCTFRATEGWLIVVSAVGEDVASYATHRTVRSWYTGTEPKMIKAA